MGQGRPAGEFRRRVNLAAAIGNCQRFPNIGAEESEVFDRQGAAARLHIGVIFRRRRS
jgi:hypothetical protein